jgi:hypothetical protein
MANPLVGNELATVQGLDATGRPSAFTETVSLVQLTNFENSMYMAAAQSATSKTTLAQVNFLNSNGVAPQSFTVQAGGVYIFDVYLSVTNNASGGLKLQFGGTATATALSADTWGYNTTTVVAQSNITSLTSTLMAFTGAVTTVNITGTLIAATTGTLFLQFAQNASFATATTLNVGSNFWVDRIV